MIYIKYCIYIIKIDLITYISNKLVIAIIIIIMVVIVIINVNCNHVLYNCVLYAWQTASHYIRTVRYARADTMWIERDVIVVDVKTNARLNVHYILLFTHLYIYFISIYIYNVFKLIF